MEEAIIERNQRHAKQSLQTPFAANKILYNAIDPRNPNNHIDDILEGTFLSLPNFAEHLSDTEKAWVDELQTKITEPINTNINIQDFIKFFKSRKEKTASSPSGRHYGHYKVIASMAAK
jgi:uncharacterized damage-inducible protein DinB